MRYKIIEHYIALLIFLITGCETSDGLLGASRDIKDSKARDVFVQEYTVYPNPYRINDTLQITVNEAWVEHSWRYSTEGEGAKIEKDGYQLCINTNESDLKGISFDWTIGVNTNRYLHQSSCCSLMGDLKEVPNDTITYTVQKGEFSFDSTNVVVIGHFILVKKR